MKIDVTGPAKKQIRESKIKYEKALKRKDYAQAKINAHRCVELFTLLAKNDPSSADKYLKNADIWKKQSERSIEAFEKSYNPKVQDSSKESEESVEEDDFSSIVTQMISKSPISWSEIGGLEETKKLMLQTLYLWGVNKPEAIHPWKGVLLFGPPGTGKTLLAAASAGEANATFINVQANKVLSKYFGESSKIISTVYEVARKKQPTILFIDEFDSLSTNRDTDGNEASRRILSELLTNMDGFNDKGEQGSVLTLAATNTPWDLDAAILSRFPRKIFVPLPDHDSCKKIIKIKLKGLDISNLDFDELANQCVQNLYSGREIESLCNHAKNTMLTESNDELADNEKLMQSIKSFKQLRTKQLKTRAMIMNDFMIGFSKIKSSISTDQLNHYQEWNEQRGE